MIAVILAKIQYGHHFRYIRRVVDKLDSPAIKELQAKDWHIVYVANAKVKWK
jgi:hypothetical protein